MDRKNRNRDTKNRYKEMENRGNKDRDLGNRDNGDKKILSMAEVWGKTFFSEKVPLVCYWVFV